MSWKTLHPELFNLVRLTPVRLATAVRKSLGMVDTATILRQQIPKGADQTVRMYRSISSRSVPFCSLLAQTGFIMTQHNYLYWNHWMHHDATTLPFIKNPKGSSRCISKKWTTYFKMPNLFRLAFLQGSLCYSWSISRNEPSHDKTNKVAYAPSVDSDQPGHPPSLIIVFAVRLKKALVLSYPLSAQRRLWSDWADAQADQSFRWAHMPLCRFCHDVAQIQSVIMMLPDELWKFTLPLNRKLGWSCICIRKLITSRWGKMHLTLQKKDISIGMHQSFVTPAPVGPGIAGT